MDTATSQATYRVTFKATGEVKMLTLDQLALLHPAKPARPALRLIKADEKPAVTLRFVWNGIKGADGQLQPARFHLERAYAGYTAPDGTVHGAHGDRIVVYHNSHCGRFETDVHVAFAVINDTDSQADYFTSDRFVVEPSHPLFSAVAEALIKQMEHDAKTNDKRAARRPGSPNGDCYRADAAKVRSLLAALA